ncbi:MAG TPA: site-2 protease family protein [Myxococcaceae bacterium]|jgi:Zn-dependent protease/predicted transcriptional regulator
MQGWRGSFRVASFRGIPILIHFSLLLALPLLTLLFGKVFQQAGASAGMGQEQLGGVRYLWGLGVALGLFASVLVHELAHVIYALRKGGEVRSITLMIVGGVSEVTEMPKRHRDEVLMALAGPLTSLGLAGLFFGVLLVLPQMRSFALPFCIFYLGMVNVMLGLFNLVPAFPMDGGRILRGLLAGKLGMVRATSISAWVGRAFAVLFVIVGVLTVNPMLAIIGFFIFTGAGNESRQVLMRAELEKLRVEQMMSPRFHGLDVNTSLAEALAELRHERKLALPITELEQPVGWVALADVLAVAEAERAGRSVREVLKPAAVVSPEEDGWKALRRIIEAQPPVLLVLEQGRMVGTLDGNDIHAAMTLQVARQERERTRASRWRQERPA